MVANYSTFHRTIRPYTDSLTTISIHLGLGLVNLGGGTKATAQADTDRQVEFSPLTS